MHSHQVVQPVFHTVFLANEGSQWVGPPQTLFSKKSTKANKYCKYDP